MYLSLLNFSKKHVSNVKNKFFTLSFVPAQAAKAAKV